MLDLVRRHKQSAPGSADLASAIPVAPAVGIPSMCSAHPVVIAATLRECAAHGRPALIEATSNQVNQDGGYTGMTPAGFRRFVEAHGRPHRGPRRPACWCWAATTSAPTPGASGPRRKGHGQEAEVMVAQYVAAGFRKIHLDCSMSCADDPVPLPEADIAARAVRLCLAAEQAWRDAPDRGEPPVYVIGTEVPVPGGGAARTWTMLAGRCGRPARA